MPPVADRRILAISQRGFRREVKGLFANVSDQLRSVLVRYADSAGVIQPRYEVPLRQAAGQIVKSMFIGPDGISSYTGENGDIPLAPYPALLNKWLVYAIASQVKAHEKWLKKNTPDDVFAYLARRRRKPAVQIATENPFLRREGESDEDYRQRLDDLRIFRPNPMAELDPSRQWVPPHKWTDSRGYRLSDRIWETSEDTRAKIDQVIRESLREGRGALETAKLLERFLNPDAASLRTSKPYGTDASYSAMRLARTEISRAANAASFQSAYMNPYAQGGDWALSPSHPKTDICDGYASIGMGGTRNRPPYPLESCPIPPAHPQCVTPGQNIRTRHGIIPIEDVRADDYVLTHTGQYCRVKDVWSRSVENELVYEIYAGDDAFTVTGDHPIYSRGEWIKAKDLQYGEFGNILSYIDRKSPAFVECAVDYVAICIYTGLVYNMSVEGDESYTVNGFAVHNCLCRFQVFMASPEEVTARLRAVMGDARAEHLEPYLTPAAADEFIQSLIGDYLFKLVAQLAA